MLTSSIRRANGVRTKVGRLRKHRNLIGFHLSSLYNENIELIRA